MKLKDTVEIADVHRALGYSEFHKLLSVHALLRSISILYIPLIISMSIVQYDRHA